MKKKIGISLSCPISCTDETGTSRLEGFMNITTFYKSGPINHSYRHARSLSQSHQETDIVHK